MLPTIVLTCPIDGLTMPTKTSTGKGDIEKNGEIGGHLHLAAATMTCVNGHTWQVSEMTMERVA